MAEYTKGERLWGGMMGSGEVASVSAALVTIRLANGQYLQLPQGEVSLFFGRVKEPADA